MGTVRPSDQARVEFPAFPTGDPGTDEIGNPLPVLIDIEGQCIPERGIERVRFNAVNPVDLRRPENRSAVRIQGPVADLGHALGQTGMIDQLALTRHFLPSNRAGPGQVGDDVPALGKGGAHRQREYGQGQQIHLKNHDLQRLIALHQIDRTDPGDRCDHRDDRDSKGAQRSAAEPGPDRDQCQGRQRDKHQGQGRLEEDRR